MSLFFAWCGQSIAVSASASILPMNIQDWFPLGWTGWISLQSTTQSLLHHHSSKASILLHSAFFIVQLSHPYMTTGKTIALTTWNFQKRFRRNIQKTKIMASGPITSWEIDEETLETVKDFILEGSKITAGEGNGTPLQYSCLENPMDGGAW